MSAPPPAAPQSWQFRSESEADTETLGQAIGAQLEPGTVVALIGNLGAGKTQLVRAIVGGTGGDPALVSSPTFVLIQEYPGRLMIYHFDTYRLHDSTEFLELGFDEILESGGVCLIEWADRVADVLPEDPVRIEIEIGGPTTRVFRFTGTGEKSNELIRRLSNQLSD